MKTSYKKLGRAVVGFNEITGEMVVYNKASDACVDGFQQSHISRCCTKGRGKHKGFVWMYLDEHEEGI